MNHLTVTPRCTLSGPLSCTATCPLSFVTIVQLGLLATMRNGMCAVNVSPGEPERKSMSTPADACPQRSNTCHRGLPCVCTRYGCCKLRDAEFYTPHHAAANKNTRLLACTRPLSTGSTRSSVVALALSLLNRHAQRKQGRTSQTCRVEPRTSTCPCASS